MVVLLHRRRGGVTVIYRCEISDAMNVTQNLSVGVYTNNIGIQGMTIKMLVDCANSPVWLGGPILVFYISDYTSQNTL